MKSIFKILPYIIESWTNQPLDRSRVEELAPSSHPLKDMSNKKSMERRRQKERTLTVEPIRQYNQHLNELSTNELLMVNMSLVIPKQNSRQMNPSASIQ